MATHESTACADARPGVLPLGRCYGDLLAAAYSRGWADGCFAAPFEPTDRTDSAGLASQGLSSADFARSLWGHRAGEPPAGLDLNAPLWYARGFAEAITVAAP
jgi:hypothetical protein